MAEWRLGTAGFGYADWSGAFYPEGLKSGDWLTYYARYFDTVELDTTFHAAPDAERVRRWAEAVPEHFRFCVKTPRAITHDQPLDQAADPMRRFVETVLELQDKLGSVLIQFPPSFMAEQAGRLERFLATLTPGLRFAVEFRHRSWGTPQTLDLLRQRGCALVLAEYRTRPSRLMVTADFVYVRWIGEHGQFPAYAAEQADLTSSLKWWMAKLSRLAPEVRTIYGIFNNDYAGYAIGSCNRFKGMMGLPVRQPAIQEQGQLFE